MDRILRDAATRGARYLEELETRSVVPSQETLERLSELGGPMPGKPTDPADVLALLDEVGSPATLASAGGRFFGFVIGGSLPAALAANWLGSAWDQNAALVAASPVSAALEETALRWLLDVLDLPSSCGGAFVTGGTMANFTALAAARHAVLEQAGWDVESDGLFGAPPVTVILGEEAHPTLRKALGMLGFGRTRVTVIPVDGQGEDAGGRAAHALRPHDHLHAVRQHQYGRNGPGSGDLCRGTRGRRLGARGRSVRHVGGRGARASPPRCGRGRRRFVGHGRAQVA